MIDSFSYFLRQTMVVIGMWMVGRLIIGLMHTAVKSEADNESDAVYERVLRNLMAYPAALAVWALTGFLLLVIGIPYCLTSVSVVYLILIAGALFYLWRSGKYQNIPLFKKDSDKITVWQLISGISVLLLVVIIAVICCIGVISVSVSNDSYYYYSLYPQTIAIEGRYLTSYDVFLTDVGQATAVVGCLPWFFGFEETFGIQLFLAFNLLGLFAAAVWDMMKRITAFETDEVQKSKRVITATVLSSLFLLTATPFMVMARWILANAYFMTFMFITFSLAIKAGCEARRCGGCSRETLCLGCLFIAMLSMTRMEGGMMAGLLILCICSLNIRNGDILLYFTLPVAITQILYYSTIYLKLSVNPLYSFLDFKNVAVMLLFILAIAVYVGMIRGKRMITIQKHYSLLLLAGLAAANLVLCLIDAERFIGNLKFIGLNIILQNGWGYFGFFVILALIILAGGRDKHEITFSALFTVGFILFSIAVCWARDGSLRAGIGDSGNRVLMQIVPFVVYTLTEGLGGMLLKKSE